MIAGFFDPRFIQSGFARPVPMVRAALYLPKITPGPVAVHFLLDSGADDTILHPQDALVRVGINRAVLASPQSWPQVKPYSGIGGSSDHYPWPAEYEFRHEDGRLQRVSGEILIARPTQANQSLESLLGWDVLQHFRISLDWPKRRRILLQ